MLHLALMLMNLVHFDLQLLELEVLGLLVSRRFAPLRQVYLTLVDNLPAGTILDIVFENSKF